MAITNFNYFENISCKKVVGFLLFTSLILLLVKLGFWQLRKGEHNQQLETSFFVRSHHQLSFFKINNASNMASLTGFQAKVDLTPVSKPLVYLDNQILGKKVGYEIYQVMKYQRNQPWLLVDLGFIVAYAQRNHLPVIKEITQKVKLVGTLYHTAKNPFSSQLLPEIGKQIRIQNLNYKQLSRFLGHKVLAVALQPKQQFYTIDGRVLLKRKHKLAMPSSKNYGYAVQWFAMATTMVVIGLFSFCKRYRLDGNKA
ncbi:SURF1 family protein [Parashewanella curva]|uniref:SURF1-like protein n=1 Tax=Parashewanella curva TaxID=2338552 RepID=A0A3L8PV20_9GAMM|nr:SURF1 family protein [Parashewanella curva]RLV59255.1 SURF1 family protein [Parashewanella curva]